MCMAMFYTEGGGCMKHILGEVSEADMIAMFKGLLDGKHGYAEKE